jgi:predicted Zn finger-like uncharacterized protein
MRIVCPECQAAYAVPDALIEPGKRVRCARCNAEWAPLPGVAESAARAALRDRAFAELPPTEKRAEVPADLLPAPVVPPHGSLRVTSEPPGRRPAPVTRPPGRDGTATAAWIGWVVTFVVLVGLAGAAVAWRDAVMAGWPPSARVYGALGLGPPGPSAASPAR